MESMKEVTSDTQKVLQRVQRKEKTWDWILAASKGVMMAEWWDDLMACLRDAKRVGEMDVK